MTLIETEIHMLERAKAEALRQAERAKVAYARAEGAQLWAEALQKNLAAADAVAKICEPRGKKPK